MEEINTVVFDLFGTLIYLAEESKPYSRLFIELGLQTTEEFKQGRAIALSENFENLSGLAKRLNPDKKIDLDQYENEVKNEIASATLYPETELVLKRLQERELKIGLISNLGSQYKSPFFKLGLDKYFDQVIFSCDVGLYKPDPRIYQKMFKDLNVDPSNILMTGDKIHADVDGPRSVGMNAVHLDRKTNLIGSIPTLEGIFQYL